MLSGASRGEQNGSLTTGELCNFISDSCSERSGSNPRGNSLGCSDWDPSSPAGGGMATEAMEGSASMEMENFTSSGYKKEDRKIINGVKATLSDQRKVNKNRQC